MWNRRGRSRTASFTHARGPARYCYRCPVRANMRLILLLLISLVPVANWLECRARTFHRRRRTARSKSSNRLHHQNRSPLPSKRLPVSISRIPVLKDAVANCYSPATSAIHRFFKRDSSRARRGSASWVRLRVPVQKGTQVYGDVHSHACNHFDTG
jgi:hypothetical protein